MSRSFRAARSGGPCHLHSGPTSDRAPPELRARWPAVAGEPSSRPRRGRAMSGPTLPSRSSSSSGRTGVAAVAEGCWATNRRGHRRAKAITPISTTSTSGKWKTLWKLRLTQAGRRTIASRGLPEILRHAVQHLGVTDLVWTLWPSGRAFAERRRSHDPFALRQDTHQSLLGMHLDESGERLAVFVGTIGRLDLPPARTCSLRSGRTARRVGEG